MKKIIRLLIVVVLVLPSLLFSIPAYADSCQSSTTTFQGRTIVIFKVSTSTNTCYGNWIAPTGVSSIEVFAVAGGGSGGTRSGTLAGGGGGGAGGLKIQSNFSVSPGSSYALQVGKGGDAKVSTGANGDLGNNGEDTGFSTVVATGGGGGGAYNSGSGADGGSGGGGGRSTTHGAGSGSSGQGNNGGSSTNGNNIAGGGGGAGAAGAAAGSASPSGAGGTGVTSSVSGSSTVYAGGGGGGGANGSGTGACSSNQGAIESGAAAGNGPAHTGCGGGGGGGTSGAGGSGILVLTYVSNSCSPTSTFSSGSVTLKFTSINLCNWKVPADVSSLSVEVVGGGGGGGFDSGGGGGGGGYSYSAAFGVTASSSITISVGQGGAGGISSRKYGTNGRASYFSTITANGGSGGNGCTYNGTNCQSTNNGGSGGTSSGGSSNLSGSSGGNGYCYQSSGGCSVAAGAAGTGNLSNLDSAIRYGGSGAGNDSSSVSPNIGKGGGGGQADGLNGVGTSGGSGIVVVKYQTSTCSPTTSDSNGYRIEMFATVTSCKWQIPSGVSSIDLLIVGGGGGGGFDAGGGGAGGGVIFKSGYSVTAGDFHNVVVGSGGAAANTSYVTTSSSIGSFGLPGDASQFGTLASPGGGGGGGRISAGQNGASGGGAGHGATNSGGTSTFSSDSDSSTFGSTGGASTSGYAGGGGGGGASGAGSAAASNAGGAGGAGYTSSISGSSAKYGGGGGGGIYNSATSAASGCLSGGGGGTSSAAGGAGATNTGCGGGGGGTGSTSAGSGGSGIVIVRYLYGAGKCTTSGNYSESTSGSVTVGIFTTSSQTTSTSGCTWVTPAGVTRISVLIVGGGGGAGGYFAGGGGGGGVRNINLTVNANDSFLLQVGGGGAGTSGDINNPGVGANGSESYFALGPAYYDAPGGSGSRGCTFTKTPAPENCRNTNAGGAGGNSNSGSGGAGLGASGGAGIYGGFSDAQLGEGGYESNIAVSAGKIYGSGGDGSGATNGEANTGQGGFGTNSSQNTGGNGAGGTIIIRYGDVAPTLGTVSVSGTAQFNSTLSSSISSVSGDNLTYTYYWSRADTSNGTYSVISGATSSFYLLTADDVGKYVRAGVSVNNSGGYAGRVSASNLVSTLAARIPTFSTANENASGFTVQITNYNSLFTWSASVDSSGTVSISNTGLVTVSNVRPEATPTATITTTRAGYERGSATFSAKTSKATGLTPTFGTATATADGFSVQITNYDANYNWEGTATASGSVTFSLEGIMSVTGVNPSTSSTVTVISKRLGYYDGSATFSATSTQGQARTPSFGTPTPTSDGFTVEISNYSNAYTWTGAATESGSVSISNTGLVTVTGVAMKTTSVATITTTRTGYASGSATVSEESLPGSALIPDFGGSTANTDGFTLSQKNYDSNFTYSFSFSNGGSASMDSSGVITVTGLSPGTSTTITVTTSRANYSSGSASHSGNSIVSRTVTFDSNGGSGSMSVQSSQVSAALTANTFTKQYYNFSGWRTKSDGTGTLFTDGETYGFTSDLTLYAVWTPITLTVTYNSQGGTSVDPVTTVYNGKISYPPTSPTRATYTFLGWSTSSAGSLISFEYSHGQSADFTLYAIWSLNADTPSITSHPASSSKYAGQTVTFSVTATIKDSGVISYQWKKDGIVISGATNSTYTIASVTSLDAGNYTVVVTNTLNDSTDARTSNAATLSFLTLTQLLKPNAPTVTATSGSTTSITVSYTGVSNATSHTIKVFSSGVQVGSDYLSFTSGSAITGLTAGTSYTVTVTAIGDGVSFSDSEASNSASVTTNASALQPEISTHPISATKTTDQSVTFSVVAIARDSGVLSYQWKKNGVNILSATNDEYSIGTLISASAGDYTVVVTNTKNGTSSSIESNVAKLIVNQATYSVTYSAPDKTSGSVPSDGSSPYTFNATVTLLGNTGSLTKTGYVFAGWKTSSDATVRAGGSSYSILGDVTFIAAWTQIYQLSFSANGGSGTMSALNGPTVTIPVSTFTRSGYTFSSWNSQADGNGSSVQTGITVPITQAVTLYAIWTLNSGSSSSKVIAALSMKSAGLNKGTELLSGFSNDTTTYAIYVPASVSAVVAVITREAGSLMRVEVKVNNSGSRKLTFANNSANSGALPLPSATNTLIITTISTDSSRQQFTITVYRDTKTIPTGGTSASPAPSATPSSANQVVSLVRFVVNSSNGVTEVPVSPTFSATTYSYTASFTVTQSATQLKADFTGTGITLRLKVNNGPFLPIASTGSSSTVALNKGSNSAILRVASAGGTSVDYTFTLSRAAS